MNATLRRLLYICLFICAIVACDQGHSPSTDQTYLFLESLKQVEAGGRRLQNGQLNRENLTEALAMMDRGLKLGFQVKREFLDELDLRLGKNFERYFIQGVERYRIGIEAGDREQQRQGLELLQQWAKFWGAEQSTILARLNPG